ncbi:glucose PTS transporter subunit IIA [Enterococcus raffinosus]|uniref:glucose PTS transporter subunit IIA n=1 Tax=Enterococcus raffinosus TaxID=71452 RepID=UPI000763F3F9|nr:glucose PTS transporter subunit IIA [Enterococcus raffinosus]MDT2571570.1 glucose PTS transporter subunit IIA [Enterococcus raffinosus]OJG82914.1 PTS system, glucose subfamily, IIA component [Enterococcus raffinosus]QXJ58581.1 PTS glucose transporter subunit IIA [Enterococcus raffinosus]GMS56634.1 PTS beta-glucoside transporter subunit IIABC [Enterococcus raffinosus]
MKHEDVAKQIIKNVGGAENINNAWHCMTRLRFNLKDEKQVNYAELEKIAEVVGTKYQSDQLQVVIGTNVADYFGPIVKVLGLDENNQQADGEKKGAVSLFMDTVSGVFGPIVPAIAGAGMIKGLMAGLVALNVISNQTDTYLIIDMIASGVFTFLPFFVAASAARIFKTNQYLSVAIAATLQFPTMTTAVAEGSVSAFKLFGVIPVPVFNYAGTVIPIIFAVLALSYIYRWVDKVLPQVLRTVFTPTISLFVAGLVTLTVIGPISIHLGNLLAAGVAWLFSISPVLAGVVVGAIRPIAIFTGLHHAMTPIALQNFANQGYDMLMPMMFMANMAITGATAAIYTKVKSKEEKSLVLSSAVSGLLGITEPALFGILSKYKKAFIAATIGSSIASAFISFFGVRIYGYILSSIFSLPAYIGQYFIFAVLGILIALISSFVITYMLVPVEEAEEDDFNNEVNLHSVARGSYVPLEDVPDEVFSTKMMGDGFAIKSVDGAVFAPVSGTVTTVFPSKHAIGIKTGNGIEVLVHMGIDTVTLDGKGFNVSVKVGDKVTAESKIAQMDLDYIHSQGKETMIIVVITNMERVLKFSGERNLEGQHQAGALLERALLNG